MRTVHVDALRAGARSVAPMLVGVIPFGLVAGAMPVTRGLGTGIAVGFSMLVFAGASQLAAIDVLTGGGSALVAALAAWTINLRMLLYSASLAPHLAHEPLRNRVGAAYLLTDQAYAVSISNWTGDQPVARSARLAYYLGAALLLWSTWQVCTILGALAGAAVPEEVPLTFAVPLVFLVLLVPAIKDRPSLVAAAVGGGVAVAAAELGAGHSSIMVGALSGIAAGTLADLRSAATPGSEPTPGSAS